MICDHKESMGASASLTASRPPRDKRFAKYCYFEVIYEPDDKEPYNYIGWDFRGSKILDHSVLESKSFISHWEEGQNIAVVGIHFDKCDFEGDFRSKTPSFKNCEFNRCDFGLSSWRRARFKDCRFTRCSFSMATFELCEFRDCKFSENFISGNETILAGSIFTNPAEFINGAGTNLDKQVLKDNNKTSEYQIMRLEGTKASIARAIMSSHSVHGTEEDYYKAVETYQRTSSTAKILSLKHDLARKPGLDVALQKLIELILAYIEQAIIKLAGAINCWGASVARPAVIGAGIIFVFGLIYWLSGLRPNFARSLITSADITLLVGYTKHVVSTDKSSYQLLYAVNMIVGIVWYSIFIPTIIARISRVR